MHAARSGNEARGIALLLDVDGTLINLAARPELVIVGSEVRELIGKLQGQLDGALALVSGRSIAALDELFAPFKSAAAGLHGVEVRLSASDAVVAQAPIVLPHALQVNVARIARVTPGAFLELKSACIAVHHRCGPRLVHALRAALERALDAYRPEWHMISGHQVLEIKPTAVNKGSACELLMASPAFRGRVPIYLGDDTTDLDAFGATRQLGGHAIAVGPRIAAHAQMRLPSPSAARAWLARLSRELDKCGPALEQLLGSARG